MLSVVPVLALAMIVEVGRQLRHAEQLSWRTRALQSVLLGGYAAALLVVFRMSLDGLVHRDGIERAEIVGALVFSSLLFLVALPLSDVLMRVNPEAQEVLRRAMPWSRWWKDRRYLKRKVVPEVRRTQQDVRAVLAQTERLLADLERAKIDAAEARMVWLAARQLNEHIPASVSESAGWAELQKHARDGEVDLLAPGTAPGRLERRAQHEGRRGRSPRARAKGRQSGPPRGYPRARGSNPPFQQALQDRLSWTDSFCPRGPSPAPSGSTAA